MTFDRPARILLLLGALTALALGVASLADFGDPIEKARAQAQAEARARAALVHSLWNQVLQEPEAPAPAFGVEVWLGPERTFGTTEVGAEERFARPFDVLLEMALMAASTGDLDRAREQAEALLQSFPSDVRAAEAHLHLARWASAGGREEAVRFHRAAIQAPQNQGGHLNGTSIGLIAALIEPIDVQAAKAILSAEAPCLPEPKDRARVSKSGSLAVDWDPWWRVIQERLEQADPNTDWATFLSTGPRAAEAVRQFFGGDVSTEPGLWTLRRRAGGLFAARETQEGTRILAVQESQIAERLIRSLPAEEGPAHIIRFDHDPLPPQEQVRDRDWLAGTSIGFTMHREDPLRDGREEKFRLTLLRIGLMTLALAILAAVSLAARAMARANRLAELRSTLVASVSHDLRTPIQSILLMSENLERGRVATDKSKNRYFTSIRQEAQRLRRFVEDLLDSARIDRGEGARIERQEVNLGEFFSGLEAAMRERAVRDGATLTVAQGALPKSLVLDPDGVYRVVWNLFENALRYGHAPEEPAKVEMEISYRSDTLQITLDDHGPGIPARYAETVFEPFEQIREPAADGGQPKHRGTGLGLSIVREIARAHGGEVEWMPSPHGARMRASFPCQPEPNPEGGAA